MSSSLQTKSRQVDGTLTDAASHAADSVDSAAQGDDLGVGEALLSRRSVRAYLPRDVPSATLRRLLELAAHSASNSNSQPWQVHVVTGEARSRLTTAVLAAHDTGARVHQREYDYQPAPQEWEEPYKARREAFGDSLYRGALGILPMDTKRRVAHHRRNYEFFGAPVGIFLTVSRNPRDGAMVDAGIFLQALMLAARGEGLDTCPQASWLDFFPVIREHLDVPEDQVIICGLALGYADHGHLANRVRTQRAPTSAWVKYYGDGRLD
jgi:nitroreductase